MSTPPQSSPLSLYVGRSKYRSIIVGCRLASSSSSSSKFYPQLLASQSCPSSLRPPPLIFPALHPFPPFILHPLYPPFRLSHHPFPMQVKRIMGIRLLQWIQCHAHVFTNRQMNIINFLLHTQMMRCGILKTKIKRPYSIQQVHKLSNNVCSDKPTHQRKDGRQLDEDSSFQKSSSICPLQV